MNLLALLLAKTGAATVTTKVVVAGAVSAAALGTAGATGVVPVDELLPGDDHAVVLEEDLGEELPVATPDAPEDDATDEATDEVTDEDGAAEEGADDGTTSVDGRQNALDALDRAQENAPAQADAGLERARAAVSGTGPQGPADAGRTPEQATRPDERAAGQSQRGAGRAMEGTAGDAAPRGAGRN